MQDNNNHIINMLDGIQEEYNCDIQKAAPNLERCNELYNVFEVIVENRLPGEIELLPDNEGVDICFNWRISFEELRKCFSIDTRSLPIKISFYRNKA